jgi:hypothetical protein
MPLRGAPFGLVLLALPACNFNIEPSWVPPAQEGGFDAAPPSDAGSDAGLAAWCREACAAEPELCMRPAWCVDAAVCTDDAPCERCLACGDR